RLHSKRHSPGFCEVRANNSLTEAPAAPLARPRGLLEKEIAEAQPGFPIRSMVEGRKAYPSRSRSSNRRHACHVVRRRSKCPAYVDTCAAICQAGPGLAAKLDVDSTVVPFMSQALGWPLVLCHRMSALPLPSRSAVPLTFHAVPGFAPTFVFDNTVAPFIIQ